MSPDPTARATDATAPVRVAARLQSVLEEGGSGFPLDRLLLTARRPYLDAFVEGRSFPPFEVEIQPTSRCNLKCTWCMGTGGHGTKPEMLPNALSATNVDAVIDGILATEVGGLRIEAVRFAGFTGEPLMNRRTTLRAMERLLAAGLQVSLFTNGVLMGPDTWATLSRLTYVHVSIDAGPTTYAQLKEGRPAGGAGHLERVIANVRGLHGARREAAEGTEVHVGYILVPESLVDLEAVARSAQRAGADRFVVKCDITGQHELGRRGLLDEAFRRVDALKQTLDDPPRFSVTAVHSRQEAGAGRRWRQARGCHYHHFMGTVASDGRTYLCDYNTLPGGAVTGDLLERTFDAVWFGQQRNELASRPPFPCRSTFCPPDANRANFFLDEIRTLVDAHGADTVMAGLDLLRERIEVQRAA